MARLPFTEPRPCKLSLCEVLADREMQDVCRLIEAKRTEQQKQWENATAYIVADNIGCSISLALATVKRSRLPHRAEQKAAFVSAILREIDQH